MIVCSCFFFFFSSRRRHTRFDCDWSSDVCSSDLTMLRSVAERELICILGPSGCGKSTLLNIVAGFLPPTSGRVLVDGRAISGPGADRGVVFQEYVLFPWLTVAGNVAFGLELKAVPSDERMRIVRHYLTLVGLNAHADKYPVQLSGGMKQRVAIARALANDPAIVLMDD